MDRRARQQQRRWPWLRQGLVLLLVVPAVLVGPWFASGALLLHTHGPDGSHDHRLPATASGADLDSLHAWHAGQHGNHGHDLHDDLARGHVPPGHVQPGDVPPGDVPPGDVPLGHVSPGLVLADTVPPGTVVERPASPVPCPEAARAALDVGQMLARVAPALLGDLASQDLGPPGVRAAPVVRRGHVSGAVRVLRSSRALLI